MRQALLLLADSRLPAGAHAHSGGVAPAVDAGLVGGNGSDLAEVVAFLRGRLHTAGLLTAAIAARACHLAATDDRGTDDRGTDDRGTGVPARAGPTRIRDTCSPTSPKTSSGCAGNRSTGSETSGARKDQSFQE